MLHFFRKIRRELLANNKTIRYLQYGVGEIILVVIGILIAIQVDNWNEERIGSEETKLLFREVSDELVQNIVNVDGVLNTMILKDSLFFKVLKKGAKYEDYKASFLLFEFPFLYGRTSLVDEDFRELLERKVNLNKLQDSMFSELKDLYGPRKINADIDDATQHDTELEFRNKLMNEQPWFSSFHEHELTDEMIRFALTDPIYRNQLHEIRFREYWRTMGILWFRTKALNLYVEIADMLNIEKDTLLVIDIKDFEHIKGVYKHGGYKVHIGGKNKLKADFYVNESLVQEWDIHPYSHSYLIGYMGGKGQNILSKIEFGNNGEVLGIRNFGDMMMVEGNRLMWKKIE